MSASWQSYNEKQPFGKGATVVTADNGLASRQRVEAARAVKTGTATPEQHRLLADADAAIASSLSGSE